MMFLLLHSKTHVRFLVCVCKMTEMGRSRLRLRALNPCLPLFTQSHRGGGTVLPTAQKKITRMLFVNARVEGGREGGKEDGSSSKNSPATL